MRKKKHQSEFAVLDTSDVLEWKKNVQKALKKTLKKTFKTVRKRSRVKKKTFCSGNNRSVVFFLLNLAKLIDFGFGVQCGNFHDQEDPGIYNNIYIYISH